MDSVSKYVKIDTIVKAVGIYASIKVAKWLASYCYAIWVYHPIPGKPILPFIGNIHQYRRMRAGCIRRPLDRDYCTWILTSFV